MEKTKEKHPAYGMINIARVLSSGTVLFGSRIKHNNYIRLEINTAEKTRDAYSEYYFPKKTVVSVQLSAAQFANMLVKSNTSGVPCTIEYTEKDGRIESLQKLDSLKTEIKNDTTKELQKIQSLTKQLSDIVTTDFKGVINKAKKDEIRDLVIQINNGINSNLDFLFERQVSKLEKVGSEIIAEAEARITSLVHETGVNALKKQNLLGE
jgi:predicted transcriptional regulator